MDAREEIDALVAFERRASGTDSERRAARHLARRLEELGREAEVENADCWPRWPLAFAAYLSLAVVGSVVSVSSPLAGAALVLVAAALTFLEAAQIAPLARRLLGRRATQNVVSREQDGKPGVIVLVAHLDAGRRAAAHGGRLRRLWPLPFVALGAVLACTLVRLTGLEGTVLTAIQFVPTTVLIATIPLLVDIALAEVAPGANDNASGVAAALALADRYGGRLEHFELWVLLTGAGESLADGMRGFLRRRRKLLDRQSTVVIGLDGVGAGTVAYTRSRGHRQLVQLCEEIATDDPGGLAFGARPVTDRAPSDAAAARGAGFPAINLGCRDEDDRVPERVEAAALARATAFAGELIGRLDAEVGPRFREP